MCAVCWGYIFLVITYKTVRILVISTNALIFNCHGKLCKIDMLIAFEYIEFDAFDLLQYFAWK